MLFFDALSTAEAVTFLGRRKWLGDIADHLSQVKGLGGHYAAPRAARAIVNVFGAIEPDQWRNRTWSDVLEVSLDVGEHLSVGPGAVPLFPLHTSASAIAALLAFPLSTFPCLSA